MSDRIRHLKLSHVVLPLDTPVSDAKVLTGRQKPLTETVLLFVEVLTEQGLEGMGFSYSKRAGGPAQYAHLAEIAEVADRPGPVRHRPDLPVAAVGGRIGRTLGRRHPGHRRTRRRAVGPQGPPRRPAAGQTALARTATPAASTTPPAASCRRPSRRSRRRPPPPWSPASAASRSKWGSRIGRPTWTGSPPMREHLGDDPADGRRQPAVGPGPRPPDVPRARGVRPGVDRGAAGRVGRGRPRRPAAAPSTPRSRPARCSPRVPEHMALIDAGYRGIVQPDAPRIGGITPVPALRDAGRARRAGAGPALRDGDPPAPGRGVPHRAVGRALRMAQPTVQRAHRDSRRPDVAAGSPRARLHAQRPDAGAARWRPRRSARDDVGDDDDAGPASGRPG